MFNEVIEVINSQAPKYRVQIVIFTAIIVIIILVAYIFFCMLLVKINKKLFKKVIEKNGNSISYQFMEKCITIAIIVIMVIIPLAGDALNESLLGSTAVIAAVVGLAANDTIKDMFAGLQISIYKPFDVGSRVMLEDGRTGIVEKLTLRHVVLCLIDTTRLIVPNSKANSMAIVNYSYLDTVPRSLEFRYNISYDSDIELAKKIIRETICDCELTLNEDKYDEKIPNSRSVYFLEMSGSSLVLGATVYYEHTIRTEVVKDEVNTRVFEALKQNNIEIPYSYMNVVMKE